GHDDGEGDDFLHVVSPGRTDLIGPACGSVVARLRNAMANGNPYVFGYGSLIWNPGFAYLSSGKALLCGAHRSLSVYSFRHRGTPEVPGLVFGLTRVGSCLGMAFEVEAARWEEVHAYLDERERDRGVYRASWRDITMLDGTRVRALT